MRLFILILFLIPNLFFGPQYIFSQSTAYEKSRDYIYLKHGQFIKGTISKNMDKHGIGIKSELGAELFYDFCEIKRIIRKPALKQLLDSSYAEIGITYGLPGIVNFNFGQWFGRTGIRLSGMFYNENFAGMELHVGYKLVDNNRQRHSIGLSYGRSGSLVDDGGIGYAGIVYNYTGPPLSIRKKHHGWFAAIGYGRYFGTGGEASANDGSFGPILQLGYMHRFIEHAPRYEVIPFPECPKPPKKKREKTAKN